MAGREGRGGRELGFKATGGGGELAIGEDEVASFDKVSIC